MAALGGVLGPITFIASWAVLGVTWQGYSPVTDPISRLAAQGSPHRAVMTGGMVALGIGLAAYASALRAATRGRPFGAAASVAAAVAALGALAVAAFPLGSSLGDGPHAAAVAVAYPSLAITPIFAAGALRSEKPTAAAASIVVGVLSGAALVASLLSVPATGLLQRLGLTIAHTWFIASGLWLASDPP